MALNLSAILNGERRIWPLPDAPTLVGRSSKNGVHIPDATVSKDHAEIVKHGEGWQIRDLGSRNGTRVNGVEAAQPLPIREGDLVEVGKVMLRVTTDNGAAGVQLSMAGGLSSSVRLRAQDILGGTTTKVGADPNRIMSLLAEAGRMLVLPRPLKETCEEILQFVEKAVPASRLLVLLREAPGSDPVQVAARYRGGSSRQPLAISRTIMDTVLNDCTSVVTGDALADARFRAQQSIVAQSVHSAMAVPLFDNERVLGLLYADTSDIRVTFGQEQLEIFTLLANMAAVKITNARLLEADRERARIAQELSTATRIQRSLLPQPPHVAGLQCNARIETCFEVGGDLYDFYLRSDGRLMFMVGDVSGKGMGAALLMSSVLSTARVLYEACHDLADLTARLNTVMNRSTEPGHFVTMFIGCLDPATGELQYVNAGHNAPLLVGEGAPRELEATGVPIAVLPEFPFEAHRLRLEPGELLAVFSDGIPEACREEEFFDTERLTQVLIESRALPDLGEVADRVIGRVEEFLAGAARGDDVTLLLMRRD